jgi:UDP:flavonoid glycosyltransferase YjiC (YdhE family)
MPFDRMVEPLQEADATVAHAGIGTTLLCLNLGKVLIVSPL